MLAAFDSEQLAVCLCVFDASIQSDSMKSAVSYTRLVTWVFREGIKARFNGTCQECNQTICFKQSGSPFGPSWDLHAA